MKYKFNSAKSALVQLILPIIALALWDVAVRFGWVPPTLIATPTDTVRALARMTADGTLFVNCLASFRRLLIGFSLGTAVGFGLGVTIGISRITAKAVESTISILSPIPPIAFTPLFIIFFGIGELSKIALIAFGSSFVVLIHAVEAVRSVDQDYVELARVLGKRPHEFVVMIVLPSAVPHIFTGLRIAMALSWTLLLMAEIISGSNGLGWLIWDSRNFSRSDDMLGAMIVIGVLGRVTDYALLTVLRLLTPWRRTYGGWQEAQLNNKYPTKMLSH